MQCRAKKIEKRNSMAMKKYVEKERAERKEKKIFTHIYIYIYNGVRIIRTGKEFGRERENGRERESTLADVIAFSDEPYVRINENRPR